MSEFARLLQHHLNQTRAGLYGQFEHAFNFNTGADQNELLKIGPGESITFRGELLNGQPCSLIASNNLTSSSGAGFAAQRTPANDRTIVIPVAPQDGNATLEFSCPTTDPGGAGEVVSHVIVDRFTSSEDRWDAIDENLARIFTKTAPGTNDIVSSQAGDYYCSAGRIPVGDGTGELAVFDASGTFKWRAQIQDVVTLSSLIAYDDGSEVVGNMQIEESGRGTVKIVGYDASLNVDQGGLGEPPALYETAIVRNLRSALYDLEADGNGSFIVAARRNNEWDGAASAFADVWKIDAASGAISATFDKNSGGFTFTKLAVCPVTGNIAVAQTQTTTPSGESPMNILILDSDLNFVSSDLVPWSTIFGASPGRFIFPTFDSTGRLFLMTQTGFMVRYTDSTLAVRDLEVNPFAPRVLTVEARGPIGDVGHNLNGNVICSVGGPQFNDTSRIIHFDNDGVEVSDYVAPGPGGDAPGGIHVRPTRTEADLGGFFTQEKSMTPPGRQRAVAAVKYADGNITGIYFNSVEVEFDHASWRAVHSVHGPVGIGNSAPGWEYNSPL